MVDYKQILRLRAEGVSQRGIADVLGCSRNTVAAVFAAADTAGLGFAEHRISSMCTASWHARR